jgi:divalent metal cation (Fe/Co/Zn/Cd) transporter
LVGKEIMARLSFYAAKNEKLKSLEADGWHHRSDALTSGIILIGIFLEKYIWWIDGALGVFVSVMILMLAYRIVSESINPLLGETPDSELIKEIMDISREIYK